MTDHVPRNSFLGLLWANFSRDPARCIYTYLEDGDSREVIITCAELDQRARQIGSMLQHRKATGERVLLLYRRAPEFIEAFLGCLYAGVVAVPMAYTRPAASAERIERVAKNCQAKYVLTNSETIEAFKKGNAFDWGALSLEALPTDQCIVDAAVEWQLPDITDETLAYLQYSSGSTRTPRGVMISHGNIVSNLNYIQTTVKSGSDDCLLLWLPLYHDMGLVTLLFGLMTGCKIVLMSPLHFVQRPLRWLQAITRYRVTLSGGPNFAFELCASKIPLESRKDLDLSTWRHAFCGGEPVRFSTLERFSDAFSSKGFNRSSFFPCYGLAEFTLQASVSRSCKDPIVRDVATNNFQQVPDVGQCEDIGKGQVTKVVASGNVDDATRVVIVDMERLVEVPEETIGEILLQGPSKAQGYWGAAVESRETFDVFLANGDGPFLRTGDLGFFAGNQLFITGRSKELIIINGKNFSPHDIEETVQDCNPFLRRDAGAAFTMSSNDGQKLVVIQEVERGKISDYPSVRALICNAVSEARELQVQALGLVKPGTIPRTTSGKIQRSLCRDLYRQGKLSHVLHHWEVGDKTNSTLDERPEKISTDSGDHVKIGCAAVDIFDAHAIESWVVAKISSALKVGPKRISIHESIWDFGLSSVQAAGLAGELEDWLHQEVSPIVLYEYPTITSLAEYLSRLQQLPPNQIELSLQQAEQSVALCRDGIGRLPSSGGSTQAKIGIPTSTHAVIDQLPNLDQSAYSNFSRAELAERLEAVKLDKTFIEARGDRLWYEAGGERHAVLDLVGGFGAALFGHNHPELVARQQTILEAAIPLMSQASIRGYAGMLAKELAHRLERSTGKAFSSFLFSTGSEAVEAALRHSELEYYGRVKASRDLGAKEMALLLHYHRKQPLWLTKQLRADLGQVTGYAGDDLGTICDELQKKNEHVYGMPYEYLALDGAFHGKTSGAGSLTFHHHYNDVPRRSNILVTWVDPRNPQALHTAVDLRVEWTYSLSRLHTGEVVLNRQRWCRIAGLFVEPIQGEGGVRPVDPSFLAEGQALAKTYQFPIIVDEIQTGMGRCGSFTASEEFGLLGNYYIFGKSLGGGLAKISAVLIERGRHHEDFSVYHSSTFAEDDHSALIGLKALEILDQDDLINRAKGIGMQLLEELRGLQSRYPDVIADVRGMGCLVGLELIRPSSSPSYILRMIDEDLGLLASGFMLNEFGVRMMVTLSSPLTIRLEPSAYLGQADICRVVQGLDQLCEIIHYAATGRLLRYIAVESSGDGDRLAVEDWRALHPIVSEVPADDIPKVGFLGYATDTNDMLLWDPSLSDIPKDRLEILVRTLHRLMLPRVAERFQVTSETGQSVQFILVGLLLTSSLVEEMMRTNDLVWLRGRIDEAVDLLRGEGCRVVGLGGYLSIISEDCETAVRTDISLTSGNSLTVAMCCESVRRLCQERGIDLSKACVAIVGAGGNICSAVARIMASEVAQLVLVGRSVKQPSLLNLGRQLYEDAWTCIQNKNGKPLTGIARMLHEHADELRESLGVQGRSMDQPGSRLYEELKNQSSEVLPIHLTDDMNHLRESSVIITGSNAADNIIFPEHLGEKTSVIFDVAVPSDVSGQVALQRPDIRVVCSGVVRLPNSQAINLKIGNLPRGSTYACMSEALLLGLEGQSGHFSFGALNLGEIEEIMGMAVKNGFLPDIDSVPVDL